MLVILWAIVKMMVSIIDFRCEITIDVYPEIFFLVQELLALRTARPRPVDLEAKHGFCSV